MQSEWPRAFSQQLETIPTPICCRQFCIVGQKPKLPQDKYTHITYLKIRPKKDYVHNDISNVQREITDLAYVPASIHFAQVVANPDAG